MEIEKTRSEIQKPSSFIGSVPEQLTVTNCFEIQPSYSVGNKLVAYTLRKHNIK